MQVAGEVTVVDPDKIQDQLRVAFQACTVMKKRKRHHDIDRKRPAKKRRQIFSSSEENEEENLREETEEPAFQDTLVDYEEYPDDA